MRGGGHQQRDVEAVERGEPGDEGGGEEAGYPCAIPHTEPNEQGDQEESQGIFEAGRGEIDEGL